MYSIPLCNLQGDSSVHVVTRSAARTADSADPTTDMREAVTHPITDHNRNTSHWVKVIIASSSSPSPFPHYAHSPPCRPNSLLFLKCSRSPPTRSVVKLPQFLSFWTAHRDLSCALVPVPSLYVTPHFSTTCTIMLYNLFRHYQVLIPLFCSGSPFCRAISPLYHNTSHDSSPERPRAPTLTSNQKRLSHPDVSAVVRSRSGKSQSGPALFVTIRPMVPTYSSDASFKTTSSSPSSQHTNSTELSTLPSHFRTSPIDHSATGPFGVLGLLSASETRLPSRPVLGSALPIIQPRSALHSEMEQETPRRQCVSFAMSDHQLALVE